MTMYWTGMTRNGTGMSSIKQVSAGIGTGVQYWTCTTKYETSWSSIRQVWDKYEQ